MKSIPLLSVLLIFLAGMSVPLAVTLNVMLGRGVKNPLFATMIVPALCALVIALLLVALRNPLPAWDDLKDVPWYFWTGGALFAFYLLTLMFHSPKTGFGLATSLVVAGQLVMGLIIDHFGLFGLPQISVSPGRIAGVGAVMAGVALIKFF